MDFKKNPKVDFKDIKDLSRNEARDEMEALREEIEYHDYLYYVKNQPKISDALYDKLFRRLQELEETFTELDSPTSPTRRVGAEPVDKLKKVEHAAPMISLNAALEERKVKEFDDTLRRLTQEMLATMHEREGVGLAANQVGRLRRVLVAGIEDEEYVLVNPVIESASQETEKGERPVTFDQISQFNKVKFVVPDDLPMPVYPITTGIFANASHPNAAKLFIAFVLSKEQQHHLTAAGAISVRPDVEPPPGLKPLSNYRIADGYISFISEEIQAKELRKRFEGYIGPPQGAYISTSPNPSSK